MLFSDQLDNQVIGALALITDVIPGNGKKCILAFGTVGASPKSEFQFVVYPEAPLVGTSIQIAKEQRVRLVSGSAMITWLSSHCGTFGVPLDSADSDRGATKIGDPG